MIAGKQTRVSLGVVVIGMAGESVRCFCSDLCRLMMLLGTPDGLKQMSKYLVAVYKAEGIMRPMPARTWGAHREGQHTKFSGLAPLEALADGPDPVVPNFCKAVDDFGAAVAEIEQTGIYDIARMMRIADGHITLAIHAGGSQMKSARYNSMDIGRLIWVTLHLLGWIQPRALRQLEFVAVAQRQHGGLRLMTPYAGNAEIFEQLLAGQPIFIFNTRPCWPQVGGVWVWVFTVL